MIEASPLLIIGVWSGFHFLWPNYTVWVPMSDLSTLSSGTSIHPDDRCLTTLGSLAHVLCEILAHAARGAHLRSTNITIGHSTPKDWSVQLIILILLIIYNNNINNTNITNITNLNNNYNSSINTININIIVIIIIEILSFQ